jgi:hypothetical protein
VTAEEDEFGDWVRDAWQPSIKIIAGAFQEATSCDSVVAEGFANAVLARLCLHDPPLAVKVLDVD